MAQDPLDVFKARPAHLGNRRIPPPDTTPPVETQPSRRFDGRVWLQNRKMWLVGVGLLIVVLGVFYLWQDFVPLKGVEFTNAQYADLTELRKLIPIADGQKTMAEVEADAIITLVKRHPWVKDATVSKGLNGILEVEITEKKPVLLVLNQDGVPQYYMDESGYPMNWVRGASFDVLPISGNTPRYQPGKKVPNGTLLTLAQDLAKLSDQVTALIASLELRPDGRVVGRAASINQNIPPRIELGKNRFEDRLLTLKAFWNQSVLPYPQKNIREIDLRWEGQVVTNEPNEQK
ncbi:MAG: FtsQ-type POTRA domain-containing protein [Bacteroidetes Order II. Incertae sedis bacterium]|nr:FtsQ-type POTRA domain-containing protein [Bacteroidetes Order II. bacterium]